MGYNTTLCPSQRDFYESSIFSVASIVTVYHNYYRALAVNVRHIACSDVSVVLEPSVFAAATATCSFRPTSSSSTITARPTPRRRLSTIIRTPLTSTLGAVTSNWSSRRHRRRRCSTLRHDCTPGRTSRPCLTAAVDDAYIIIIINSTTSSSNTSAFLAVCIIS